MEHEYKGLGSREAARLLVEYGENILPNKKRDGPLKIFAGQFRDALILILIAAAALSAFMGEVSEAFTILAIIFLNAVLGFFQEFRTERTLERLQEMAAPEATVLRDGKRRQLPASQLVPGDVVFLQAGDKVPADGTLLSDSGLACDEAMLTGESEPVEKKAGGQDGQVYMGTSVTKGSGVFQVTKTGEDAQMGRIAGMLGEIEEPETPLQKKLAELSKWIGIGCLAICAIVAVTGIWRGEDPFDMLLVGISLSVAAVPEGLPAIVTIALALSVNRMVKRRALVRRLHAVETLGCANVICSDKTGTLTENRMTVKALRTWNGLAESAGRGERFFSEGHQVNLAEQPDFSMLLKIAALCNTVPRHRGDPMERALLSAASRCGVRREELPLTVERELPFDSSRKMMSVTVRRQGGGFLLMTKGAPDLLLARCSSYLCGGRVRPLDAAARRQLQGQNDELAQKALRVLGFAYREAASSQDLREEDLVFVGLAGLLDPPRKEAFAAVEKCRRAGIRPVMITGDHSLTARAIAGELDICREGDVVLTGRELDNMTDEELRRALPKTAVFARVTPAHKLRIVRALREEGNVVAMTGDGVNDAPAIKEADIGVAMGVTGTDVTREAASVILLDDNFATLVAAVEEGRIIYQNIRKFIRYLISCNIGEVVTMFFAMLMGMPVPLLPIQILLVNLATDGLPAIALGLEPGEKDVMDRPPRKGGESVFSGGLAFTVIVRGFLIGLTTLWVFVGILKGSGSLDAARTGALVTLVATQLIHVFECKSERRSIFSINPFNNIRLILAVLVSAAAICGAVYWPVMRSVFATVPLNQEELTLALSSCLVVPLVSAILLKLRGLATSARGGERPAEKWKAERRNRVSLFSRAGKPPAASEK